MPESPHNKDYLAKAVEALVRGLESADPKLAADSPSLSATVLRPYSAGYIDALDEIIAKIESIEQRLRSKKEGVAQEAADELTSIIKQLGLL